MLRTGNGCSEVVRGEGPIVILGGGPSLTQAQVDFVRGKARVIAINNAFLRAPWADVLYAPDARWWRKHGGRLELRAFPGQSCSLDATNQAGADHRLRYRRDVIWSDDPRELGRCEHGHAGYQAMNMADLAGGAPIILLGYDANDDGPANWHNDHPWPRPKGVAAKIRRSFAVARPEIEKRVRVINCSPGTAIDAFPCMTLEEAFATCAELVTG